MNLKKYTFFGFFGALALTLGLAGCGSKPGVTTKTYLDVDVVNATTRYSSGDKFTSEGLKVFTFEQKGEEKINQKETTDYKLSIEEGTVLEAGEFTVNVTSTVDANIVPASYTIDVSDFINYIDDEVVRLHHDYKNPDGTNRNFYTDGISEVTVYKFIDGDTTHFKMKGNQVLPAGRAEIIKSRYYGIDTPESTGSIEPWGKKASNFTKSVLESCAEGTIVVTSTLGDEYAEPEPDSTGSRFVSMVWFSEKPNAAYDELRLLNLYIVQEGLSAVKGVDKFPEYADAFLNAQTQARDLKLNLHKGLDADPDYNYGAYQDTSLFDLQEDQINLMKDPNAESKYNGANVILTGVVAGYVDSTLYLQASRESEDGDGLEYASINVYCGMQQIPSRFQQVNTYVRVPGKVTYNPTFGFQVSDTKFPQNAIGEPGERDAVILHKADFVEGTELEVKDFVIPAAEVDKNNINMFQSPITIQEIVTVTGGAKKAPGNDNPALTLYIKPDGFTGNRYEYNIRLTFRYRPGMNKPHPNYQDKNTYLETVDDFVGKRFKVSGIFTAFRYNENEEYKYQICPRVNADLLLIEE